MKFPRFQSRVEQTANAIIQYVLSFCETQIRHFHNDATKIKRKIYICKKNVLCPEPWPEGDRLVRVSTWGNPYGRDYLTIMLDRF